MIAADPKLITQGEFATGDEDTDVISTVLGSCVAACLWDPVAGIGGMNHILLPDNTGSSSDITGASVNSMELLINAIIKQGGLKCRLRAKVFGGGKMISLASEVGKRNIEFVLGFLEDEGIECFANSLGGEQARRVMFWPHSGRARQKLLGRVDISEERIPVPVKRLGEDVELF